MTADTSSLPHQRLPLPPWTLAGFALALAALALVAYLFIRAFSASVESSAEVAHTLSVLERLETLLSSVKDAETGQRGYLLTGNTAYLTPFNTAGAQISASAAALRELTADNSVQQRRLGLIEREIEVKMGELNQTITLRRNGDAAAALAIVGTDQGRAVMEAIRSGIAIMVRDERTLLADREAMLRSTNLTALAVTLGTLGVLAALVLGFAVVAAREHRSRERESWLRTGQVGLAQRLQGERRVQQLGDDALAFVAHYVGAQVAALFVPAGDGTFTSVAGYALPAGAQLASFSPGSGLVGQAARDRAMLHVQDVPADYLKVSSGVGHAQARELIVAPLAIDGVVEAVAEFGFFGATEPWVDQFLARVAEPLAVAVRTAADRGRLQALLKETQRQSEELQTQQEELRVSNEELEEQGTALKESTARLEEQRAELEQTNAQLEEQADVLAGQKEALTSAQAALRQRADLLESANQYKTEFLANMSHELRTPLNSTLILSKLLAENKHGNLSVEQVKYADTINSAGNDLLTLINDILDLSKIEARKVDLAIEPVNLRHLAEGLQAGLEPLAAQKHLQFVVDIAGDVPPTITSDTQRLAQILRNLLSNAIKFTERGHVSLHIACVDAAQVAFSVSDTGIGIAAAHHDTIFEAFRQADGSTHRKYGGTGLGLSISRDLATLLHGHISVTSSEGKGSTFTLTVPLVLDDTRAVQAAPVAPAPHSTTAVDTAPAHWIDDDRATLSPDRKRLLVVEDDRHFAVVLRDLARERGYQVIAVATAADAMAAAQAYRPGAMVLDINLPDQSGLALLDRFKRDAKLRAIPVHITSVLDYSRDALERGAIGYNLKPVSREQLELALRRLDERATQALRRILVIEDDARQRASVRELLTMDDVDIVDASSANEAATLLAEQRFDCVVMDLNLPDVSGERLLEQMAAQGGHQLPPVIVYTGRSLTVGEEQSLRRFADSIIIKGARSPERLLDEVTLFLHQVDAKLPLERQQMLQSVRGRDERLDGRRILVAEDDVRNVFAISSVLEPHGVDVQIARNGAEAVAAVVETARGNAPAIDLVLMDIMMPEMDGLTAMREIRALPAFRRLPIIALTAKAMPDDQQVCLAAGANDYIAKPLDADKLISLVRVWMPRRET